MTQHEFSPQENTQEIWSAALNTLQNTEDGQQPYLLGQKITTVPPNSRNPEQIILRHNYDGPWRDVRRTLALTALGPVSYQYSVFYEGSVDDSENIDESYGADAPETLEWLSDVANDARRQKTQNDSH